MSLGQWIGRTSQNQHAELHRTPETRRASVGTYLPVRVTRAGSELAGRRSLLRLSPLKRRLHGVMKFQDGETTMEVEMKIRGLMMDPVTNMPIVILKDVGGNTVLPIWVGIYEANAIALEIEKVPRRGP